MILRNNFFFFFHTNSRRDFLDVLLLLLFLRFYNNNTINCIFLFNENQAVSIYAGLIDLSRATNVSWQRPL